MSTAYSSKRATRRASATVGTQLRADGEERGARTKSIATYQPVPSISNGGVGVEEADVDVC
jgi:hypothetical protein